MKWSTWKEKERDWWARWVTLKMSRVGKELTEWLTQPTQHLVFSPRSPLIFQTAKVNFFIEKEYHIQTFMIYAQARRKLDYWCICYCPVRISRGLQLWSVAWWVNHGQDCGRAGRHTALRIWKKPLTWQDNQRRSKSSMVLKKRSDTSFSALWHRMLIHGLLKYK